MESYAVQLKKAIEKIARQVYDSQSPTKKVHATLVSVNPLKFQINDKLFIYGDILISPRFRVFREDEIGRSFVFQEDEMGQQYIYCYEATKKRGENGIPYHYEGTHHFENGQVQCTLYGTCSCGGTTTVTHGTIEKYTGEVVDQMHKQGLHTED